VEKELASGMPSADAIRHYLGPRLFDEYADTEPGTSGLAPEDGGNYAHRLLADGIARARRRKTLREGSSAPGDTAWHWCLRAHRRDRDFPRACVRGEARRGGSGLARPYGARHAEVTAPEQVRCPARAGEWTECWRVDVWVGGVGGGVGWGWV
jgi:hypothetical protein